MTQLWKLYKSKQTSYEGNKGFTLVELIVALVVMSVLCTMAVAGLKGWQEKATHRHNIETAKSIFTAAQMQLTQYSERGQLTELLDLISEGGKADPKDYLTGGKSISHQEGTVMIGGGCDSENMGNVYYLMAEKGDYDRYEEIKAVPLDVLKGRSHTSKDRRLRALYDMIDPYISDKSLLDGALCIEFNPEPKVSLIYAVFFDSKAEAFTYEEKSDFQAGGDA